MRIVFAGTPEVAVPSLRKFIDHPEIDVAAVISRPPARRSRKRSVSDSPVSHVAQEHGITILTPASPGDEEFQQAIAEIKPDIAPIVAYGGLIPAPLLAVPRLGWVNLHFSLLPQWRGAAPVNAAIAAGDEVTGASTFQLEEGLDTGPVFGTVTEKIGPADTAGDLLHRLSLSGAQLLVDTVEGVHQGIITGVTQQHELSSYAPKISVEDTRLNFQLPAYILDRQVRAYSPLPGSWCTYNGEKMLVEQVHMLTAQQQQEIGPAPGAPCGQLVWTKKQLAVHTSDGLLGVDRVKPFGKKSMNAMDWVRGARLEVGELWS